MPSGAQGTRRPPGALLAWLARTVGDAALPDPTVVPAGTSIRAAADVLARSAQPACFVTDSAGKALGIADAASLLAAALVGAGPIETGPIETALEVPPALVDASLPLPLAAPRLIGRRRALGVVRADGRPLGLLTAEALLAPLLRPLGGWPDAVPEGWTGRAHLWASLHADGQNAVAIQAAMATLTDALTAHIAADCTAAMAADGWGPPPVGFTVLIMGSGGRGESFLHPDQDNGFILEDYPDSHHDAIDRWFIELAERFTRALDTAGFPLCRGNVMATNPVWRKSLGQWRAQVAGWAERHSQQAVMWADIFLDFRAVGGTAGLGSQLRDAVLGILAEHPLYLKQLSWEHVRQDLPLGLFGRLLGEPDAHHHGEIDLKLRATMPLVGLVRALALRHGIAATSTPARLDVLVGAGRVSEPLGTVLAEDFAMLTELRLRRQLADFEAGRPVGNHLALADLGERDRKRLIALFHTVDTLRRSAATEFGGRLG